MKKTIKKTLLFAFLFNVIISHSQQNSLYNTYSLDPLLLNIAYAGANCTEANLHYRAQWIGLKETPKVFQVNAHTSFDSSNAIGLRINSQSMGLLNNLGATVGYCYRFNVNQKAKVHLGIGIGWSQASLNTQKATVIDANDKTLNNNNRQTANGFDSEFGAMLISKKIKAGISALHLYNTNPDFNGSSGYKALPQLNTQFSYVFFKDQKVELEPWLLNRYTIKGDNIVEGMLRVNFLKAFTAGAGYRSGYGIMALLGAKVSNIKIAYSFDYGATQNATNLGTSHQIMLGFIICKNAKTTSSDQSLSATAQPSASATPTQAQVKEPVKIVLAESITTFEGVMKNMSENDAPIKNTKVKLLNDKGELLHETITNSLGGFAFKNISSEKDYVIQLDDSHENIKEGSKISLSNINGKVVKTFIKSKEPFNFKVLSSDESFLSEMKADELTMAMIISGYLFDENHNPITNAHIKIKDEQDKEIQKVISDQTGKFNFVQVSNDKNYSLEVDETVTNLKNINRIQIANSSGKIYKIIDLASGKFSFKILESDKNELGSLVVGEAEMKQKEIKEKEIKEKEIISQEPLVTGTTNEVSNAVESKPAKIKTVGQRTKEKPELNFFSESYLFYTSNSFAISRENEAIIATVAENILKNSGKVEIVNYNAKKVNSNSPEAELLTYRVRVVAQDLIRHGVKPQNILFNNVKEDAPDANENKIKFRY